MFFPCILKTSAFIECLAGCFYRNPRGQSVGKYLDLAESLQKKNYPVSLRQWLKPIFWKLCRSVFTNLGKFLFHTSVSVSVRFVLPAGCISSRSCSCWKFRRENWPLSLRFLIAYSLQNLFCSSIRTRYVSLIPEGTRNNLTVNFASESISRHSSLGNKL